MKQDGDIVLQAAAPSDATLLSNLLELYIHDMSEAFPGVRLGADGRFGYKNLELYWSEPARRFPFIIRRGTEVMGFALVTRGSPVTDDPDVFDVAEFFVLRQHRRSGAGRQAAFLLWSRFPGRWTVRVAEANVAALPFWSGAVAAFTRGTSTASLHPGQSHAWRVFMFESPARAS